jgi:hypothetical protein
VNQEHSELLILVFLSMTEFSSRLFIQCHSSTLSCLSSARRYSMHRIAGIQLSLCPLFYQPCCISLPAKARYDSWKYLDSAAMSRQYRLEQIEMVHLLGRRASTSFPRKEKTADESQYFKRGDHAWSVSPVLILLVDLLYLIWLKPSDAQLERCCRGHRWYPLRRTFGKAEVKQYLIKIGLFVDTLVQLHLVLLVQWRSGVQLE